MGIWSADYDVYEVHDSIDEDISEDGINCSVSLHCAANQRHLVARELMSTRHQWPYLPASLAPVATRVKIKLFPSVTTTDVTGQGLVYDMAVLGVTYTTDIKDALSEELVPSVRFVRRDHRGYVWREPNDDLDVNEPGDPITEEEAPAVQEFNMVLVRTHYDIDLGSMPTNWKKYIGKVHNKTFTSPILQEEFEAGSLRFDTPRVSRTVRTDEKEQLNLQTRWAYREQGWNKFYRPASDTYEPILRLDDESEDTYVVHNNFPLEDLTPVFFNDE